jgi:hypothetical protein
MVGDERLQLKHEDWQSRMSSIEGTSVSGESRKRNAEIVLAARNNHVYRP